MIKPVYIAVMCLIMSAKVAAVDLEETRVLAEQGDAWYQTELAMMYHKGKGVDKDNEQAAKWYRLAAEQGFSKAQANLGVMYAEGQGLEQDYTIASAWFRKAAEQGNALAQHNLGLIYGRGLGVEKNFVEAYIWESLAATSDNKEAIKNRDMLIEQLSDEELKTAQRRESFLYLKIEQRKRSQ